MLVGLHGKMGAGKNEAAKRLALLSGERVIEISYAAKLKASAAALLDVTVDDLEYAKNDGRALVAIAIPGRTAEVQTVRSFLQRYGTESHRDIFGVDFWLDVALPVPRQGLSPHAGQLWVVTDVRFENEVERVRDLGGVVVGIRGLEEATGSHASELPVECDVWIDNTIRDDGYASLDDQLRDLLDRLAGWCAPHARRAA